MSRRWVTGAGDHTVGDVLRKLGEPESATGEGRVFVGRRRVATAEAPLSPGDEVVVHAPGALPDVRILGDFQGLVAVLKPAGLSSEPDRHGGASVLRAVAESLGVPEAELHVATRLDANVSGVVIVANGARAKKVAAELARDGALERRYLGILAGALEPAAGKWDLPLGKGRSGRPGVGGPDAEPAITLFERVAEVRGPRAVFTLARFDLVTGRTHQIRLHAEAAGAPLLGDALHGGPKRVTLEGGAVVALGRIALHAARVRVTRTGLGTEWDVVAPFPEDLASLWERLGGDRRVLYGEHAPCDQRP